MTKELYLDLLEKCLLGTIYEDAPIDFWSGGEFNPAVRAEGKDWPSQAHSMIGAKRMRNLRDLCEEAIAAEISGDFMETGAWRGEACIMMAAVLKANQIANRAVWVADSFEGLPTPACPQDAGDRHHTFKQLAVSLEQVQANFRSYGLLSDQVRFFKGWFADTLKSAPIEKLAILRLDGDMYQSTIEALDALNDKVSAGGYVIVDDFALPPCRGAVTDFRARHGIVAPIIPIDWSGVYWRKA